MSIEALDSRRCFRMCRAVQTVIEGRELDGLAEVCSSQVEEGGEVEAVESAESVLLGQVSRRPPDLRRHFECEVVRPVSVQIRFGRSVFLGGQTTFTAVARKSTPRFGVGDYRRADERRFTTRRLISAEPLSST